MQKILPDNRSRVSTLPPPPPLRQSLGCLSWTTCVRPPPSSRSTSGCSAPWCHPPSPVSTTGWSRSSGLNSAETDHLAQLIPLCLGLSLRSGEELWSQCVTHNIKMHSPKREESHGCCWSLGHISIFYLWPSAGPMCKHYQPKTKEFVLNLWELPKNTELVSLVKYEEEARISPPSAQPRFLQSAPSTCTPTMPFFQILFSTLPHHSCCLPPSPPPGQSLEQNWYFLQCPLLIGVQLGLLTS